jgi:hypothetical protein
MTLLSMRTPEGRPWRDELERVVASRLHTLRVNVMRRYLGERIRDQRSYFNDRRQSHHRHNRSVELVARSLLLLTALVVGAKMLREGPKIKNWLIFGALTLPALGAGVMAWRTFFEPHRLLRSYLHCSAELASVEQRLDVLVASIATSVDPDPQIAFRRLVLEAESIVSEDLRRWWIIVEPEPPRA